MTLFPRYSLAVLTASKHPLIDTFDVDCCIMDEAGQIPQPAALGALLKTKRLHDHTFLFYF
jgi:superfamily I DNA and/or RNA helicase